MKRTRDLDRARARSRSPLTSAEVQYAEALGRAVRAVRLRLGISMAAVADAALVSRFTVDAIEHATRRTRRSTLARIAAALVELADPDASFAMDPDRLVDVWVAAAGPALAPESPWQARIERRARRRHRRRLQGYQETARVEERARLLAERWIAEGDG